MKERPPFPAYVRGHVALLLALVCLLGARRAAADDRPTLSGAWSASGLHESWSVVEWGEACGPRPAPQGAGGGAVQIREQGGELSIIGAGRAFSTAECWEQMPGISRSSHSQSGGGRAWSTRCASPPNDSRRTAITTTIRATDSTISLSETGDYAFTIKDTNCHATVTRSRSFSLVHRDGDEPPASPASAAPTSTPASAPAPAVVHEPRAATRCSGSPGDAVRLEVHPSRKLLRAGDRFAFRALVLDREGCATGTRPVWTIAPGPLAASASIDAAGTLSVAADASEGTLELAATVGGTSISLYVDVATPEHFDAIFALRGLDDAGEADQAVVGVIASGAVGGRTVAAQDGSAERRSSFVAIVAGAAVLLAFAGLVVIFRGSRPLEVPEEEGVPSGRVSLEQGYVTAAAIRRPPPSAKRPPAPRPRGKICPTCGDRYPDDAAFCGKDSTALVPVN